MEEMAEEEAELDKQDDFRWGKVVEVCLMDGVKSWSKKLDL